MVTGRRVKRLRDLVAQIELLPVSPDRDRLSEFRSRAVDVDTGVTPRANLPCESPRRRRSCSRRRSVILAHRA
jgi:hypothetical protein